MRSGDCSRPAAATVARRGMVPLAVIGALVLLSAVALVGSVHVQSSPDVDRDAAAAMERTEVSTQSALEEAVIQAMTQAAERPLTTTKNTTYGTELERFASDDTALFRYYVKALIATEATSTLPSAGQQVGDVETTVSTPAIEDRSSFRDALERVTITEDTDGLVTIELSEVELQSQIHGDSISSETTSVSVTLQSPLFEMHERTEAFQERLDAGVYESGFSQRFNAQLYALGWARGYAQYGGAPITEVIANRHLEPITNHALYRTQQDVFGEADPTLGNAVRQGWFCMASQDAEGLYEEYSNTEPDVSADICSRSEWLLGDAQTGKLPDPPETTDLLGAAPGMDAEHTIGVNETAYLPFRTLVAGEGTHSLESAIDRAVTVEATIDSTVETSEVTFSHDKPTDSATVTESEREHVRTAIESASVGSALSEVSAESSQNGDLSLSDITATVTVREEKTWHLNRSNGTTKSATTTETETADSTLSLAIAVDEIGPDSHASGPIAGETVADWTSAHESTMLAGHSLFETADSVPEAILTGIAGDSSDEAMAEWLESAVEPSAETGEFSGSTTEHISLADQVSDEFRAALLSDLNSVQSAVEAVNHTFERSELISDGGVDEPTPVGGLITQVKKTQAEIVEDQTTQTVAGLIKRELTDSYFTLLVQDLEAIDDGHSEALSGLDETLEDIDGGLEQGVTALQQGIHPQEPEPVPIETGEDISYEIRGSPTYLTTETVTDEEIPQVGDDKEFAPLSLTNHNHLQMPYETLAAGFFDRLSSVIGFGDPAAELPLQTAGEALRAGELAIVGAETGEYGSQESLATQTETVRKETEAGIEEFADDFTHSLLYALYPDEVRVVDEADNTVNIELAAVPETCQQSEYRCHISSDSTVADAEQQIEAALADQLEAYDTVGERAIAIGNGELVGPLTEQLSADLGADTYQPSHLNSSAAWEGTVESSVYPAFTTSAKEQTVTIAAVDELEQLDEYIREGLTDVSSDIIEDRISSTVEDQFDIDQYDDWVDGVDTPVRVPAGMPLLPVPGMWYATVNTWDVQVQGEYSRFEVSANLMTTATTTPLTYVREDATVSLPVGGADEHVGEVDPISVAERTALVVIVPPGGIGVGDRDTANPECSALYPHTGPVNGEETQCE